MKYANLHLHSIYSDGLLTPRQLCLIGKGLEYRAVAVTDHETDGGYAELLATAEGFDDIEAIPGIEFYGMHEGVNLHLVALDYDIDHPSLRALVKERCELRYECTKKRFELGVKNGFINEITWDDVERYTPDGAWFCVGALVRTYSILRIPMPHDLPKNVFKTPEAEALGPATPSAERVIKAVREAGGIIGLAHPVNRTHFVPALVDMGLNGIEVSHPNMDEETVRLALEAAEQFNLYHCGGTDHTGAMSGMGGKHARPAFHGLTEEEYFTLRERRRN